jgi:hypothetical protein
MDCCEKLGPPNSGRIIDPRSIPPGVWLQLYVLHREAKALIEGQSPANGEQPADGEKRATPVSN